MANEPRITRQEVVEVWVRYGLRDFVVQFVALKKWHDYQPFFLHQGLEKICKGYLIGRNAKAYEKLGPRQERITIDRLAKSLSRSQGKRQRKGRQHDIGKLVAHVRRSLPQLKQVLEQSYDGYTSRAMLKVLEAGYIESRYPAVEPISQNFPIPNTTPRMYWNPLHSSSLEKCAFTIGRMVINACGQRYGIRLPTDNIFRGQVSDHDWERFCRIFFQREVLCEECRIKQASDGNSSEAQRLHTESGAQR